MNYYRDLKPGDALIPSFNVMIRSSFLITRVTPSKIEFVRFHRNARAPSNGQWFFADWEIRSFDTVEDAGYTLLR